MHKVQRPPSSALTAPLSPAARVQRNRARARQSAAASNEYLTGFIEELKVMTNNCEKSLDFSLGTATAIAKRTRECTSISNHYGLKKLLAEITETISENYAEVDSIKRAIKGSTLGALRRKGDDAISTLFDIFNRLTAVAEAVQAQLLMPTMECYEILEANDLKFPADARVTQEINDMLDEFAELGDSFKNGKLELSK